MRWSYIRKTTAALPFARYLWLTLALFGVLLLAFAGYVWSEKQIDRAFEKRYQSYRLADQLRQSSDDLTRMARSYVVTGEPRYKAHYQEILDIRDGVRSQPPGYQGIYWDLILDNRPAGAAGDAAAAVPLLDLMRQAGCTEDELLTLKRAKTNSDTLTATEFTAMQWIESGTEPLQLRRNRALALVFDERYHQAKATIMQPIHDFYVLVDQRTQNAVDAAKNQALLLRLLFVLFVVNLAYLLWRADRLLHRTLGGSVDQVHAQIARIGQGDFSSEITVAPNTENSVLGWLAKTQVSLKQTSLQRQQAEAGLKRANADLQRFAEVTAHHLQEPARRLASYAEMLPRQLAPHLNNPQAELSLAFIGQQARQMKRLLVDTERYLAADQPRAEVGSVDANQIVSQLLASFASHLAQTGTNVMQGVLPPAWIDAPRLADLFELTLRNALQFAASKAPTHFLCIRIEGERCGALVRYRVSDNGPGIEECYRERVFRVFEKLAAGGEGTGIGLAIVRRIAENSGGRAWIESAPGGGCCVLFELPLEKPA